MVNKSYILMVFRSKQHALNYVDVMKQNGIKGSIVPTPKELSLGCGYSIKAENGFLQELKALNDKYSPEFNGLYSISVVNNVMKHVKL